MHELTKWKQDTVKPFNKHETWRFAKRSVFTAASGDHPAVNTDDCLMSLTPLETSVRVNSSALSLQEVYNLHPENRHGSLSHSLTTSNIWASVGAPTSYLFINDYTQSHGFSSFFWAHIIHAISLLIEQNQSIIYRAKKPNVRWCRLSEGFFSLNCLLSSAVGWTKQNLIM